MVEGGGTIEHAIHVHHLTRVPSTNVLVEGSGIIEHLIHDQYCTCIPLADVSVKVRSTLERVSHGRHPTRVPCTDVFVECGLIVEQRAQARDAGYARRGQTGIIGVAHQITQLVLVPLCVRYPADFNRAKIWSRRAFHGVRVRNHVDRV